MLNVKKTILLIAVIFFMTSSTCQDRYLKVILNNGNINNQKMSLLNACRLAMKEHYTIIEPVLTALSDPKTHFCFDIFDYDYFVEKTKNFFKIVRYSDDLKPCVVIAGNTLFWNEVAIEEKKYIEHIPYLDEMEVSFYRGLRLRSRYNEIVEQLERGIKEPYIAIHLRIENDWPRNEGSDYCCGKIYLSKEEIIEKYINSEFTDCKNVYLATAYRGDDLVNLWLRNGYCTHTHGKGLEDLDYLELSAIDFEMCVRAHEFIGNNESSFSNLVTHMRYLLEKGPSYSYNSRDNNIYQRKDGGLHLNLRTCKFEDIKNYPHSPFCPSYKGKNRYYIKSKYID